MYHPRVPMSIISLKNSSIRLSKIIRNNLLKIVSGRHVYAAIDKCLVTYQILPQTQLALPTENYNITDTNEAEFCIYGTTAVKIIDIYDIMTGTSGLDYCFTDPPHHTPFPAPSTVPENECIDENDVVKLYLNKIYPSVVFHEPFVQFRLKKEAAMFDRFKLLCALNYTGPFTKYHVNGKKSMEGELIDGEFNGVNYTWHENGTLSTMSKMKNGVVVDFPFVWDDNGVPEYTEQTTKYGYQIDYWHHRDKPFGIYI